MTMAVGDVRVAEDADFVKFKQICEDTHGWKQEYQKHDTFVWTKANSLSSFKMVKVRCVFKDVSAVVLYDVIHDPIYRKTWDHSMADGYEICVINPNNDIGYYAIKCPVPLKNRDFVTQRSWLETGTEYFIFNHSVNHASCPLKKSTIRGISYLTGYYIRKLTDTSCQLTYVSQSDPKGNLPSWVINKLTHILAPKVVSRLYKASKKYPDWKSKNQPHLKPWLNPEQIMMTLPRLDPAHIRPVTEGLNSQSLEEGELIEADFHDEDL